MGDQRMDAFFGHLAAQEFEQCVVSSSEAVNVGAMLRNLVNFERFYVSFDWLRHEDANRMAILEVLESRIREVKLRTSLCAQLLAILDVRIQLSSMYKDLSRDFSASHRALTLTSRLATTLSDLTAPELQQYREACLYEVRSLASLLQSSHCISQLDYYPAVIKLTQAKQCIQQWEALRSRASAPYSGVYCCHVHLLHRLLAKAGVYFSEELEDLVVGGVARFGVELISKIEQACTEVDCRLSVVRVQCEEVKLVYVGPGGEEPPIDILRFIGETSRGVAIQRVLDGNPWQIATVEPGIFVCVRGSSTATAEVCLGVAARLSPVL